jgi:uncharacterized membrane protein YqiK
MITMISGFEFFFIIPIIIYAIIVGVIIWLVLRLIRANEKIALNTERIAIALANRNEIDRKKE